MLLALMSPASAQIANNTIKLGVLTDLTGIATDSTGAGSVAAARLAIEDFKAEKPDIKVELVQADHQNKADIGGALARRWSRASCHTSMASRRTSGPSAMARSQSCRRARSII